MHFNNNNQALSHCLIAFQLRLFLLLNTVVIQNHIMHYYYHIFDVSWQWAVLWLQIDCHGMLSLIITFSTLQMHEPTCHSSLRMFMLDQIIWCAKWNGLYTLKAGYRLCMQKIIEPSENLIARDWSSLWSLQIPHGKIFSMESSSQLFVSLPEPICRIKE